MTCPGCNKFAALEAVADPEVDIDVEGKYDDEPENETPEQTIERTKTATASVSGTVRICLTSECCGDEMKEVSFDVEVDIELTRAEGCACDLSDDLHVEDDTTLTERVENIGKRGKPVKNGKVYYGASTTITVKCGCGKTTGSAEWTDEIPASEMEELV